jgi:uncharacterized protein (TIGR00159 family)
MPSITLTSLVDIVIVTAFFYSLLLLVRRTRTGFVMIGMLLVGGIYLIARLFQLELTRSLLQGFFAVFLVALIIIFQEEIKQFFERLARRSLPGAKRTVPLTGPDPSGLEHLPEVLADLARDRIGALLVIAGSAPLGRHLTGGQRLDGLLSDPLVKSLFDPSSPGHDGAVIVEDGRISRFGCHLPLSANHAALRGYGTRHAAALGLSEVSDALCLVVSEERGAIGVARNGTLLQPLEPGRVRELLDEHANEIQPTGSARWRGWLLNRWPERLLALVLACAMWFVMVHESTLDIRQWTIPVKVQLVPPGYQINSIEPNQVSVSLSGSRRAFYFLGPDDVRLVLRLADAQEGDVYRAILPSDLSIPPDVTLEDVRPRQIRIRLIKKPALP